MTWEELAELRAAGMDVGGHTVNHAVLSNLPLPAARHEIVGCHEMIMERLGSPAAAPPTRTATTRRPCGARSPTGFRPGSPPRTGEHRGGGRPRCPEGAVGELDARAALVQRRPRDLQPGQRVPLGLARRVSGERPDALPAVAEEHASAKERAAS